MAESDPKPNSPRVTMTIPEVENLAKRLLTQEQTVLGDLRLAAKALQALMRAFNRYDRDPAMPDDAGPPPSAGLSMAARSSAKRVPAFPACTARTACEAIPGLRRPPGFPARREFGRECSAERT
jgi:hypothetical protein